MVVGSCLYGASDEICDWLRKRLDCNPDTAIGIVRGEDLVAAVGYEHYHPEHGDVTIMAHSDDPKWWSRSVFTQVFSYPFRVLGCHRVSSVVLGDNEHSLDFHKRLPFVQEGCRRKAYKGQHQYLWRMDETKAKASKWWREALPDPSNVAWVYNGEGLKIVRV